MIDLRRVAIIFVIAILYAVLVNAIIDAVYPSPRYEDFCKTTRYYPEKPYPIAADRKECPKYKEPTQAELDKCAEEKGMPDYRYDAYNCPVEYKGCNFCQKNFDDANEKYNFYVFLISSVLALVAIAIGLLLPPHNSLNEWVATGFMLGGLITLFFGTFRYYRYLGRYIKPLVIFVELIIVIYLAYKKLKDIKTNVETGRKKKR
ncbi:DUF202 domain-containing protein [Candidatus Woesearchaeota archaeon]|nr:DUF202 domain-containing protein [Candidatus Woesearchaeota archaeon]